MDQSRLVVLLLIVVGIIALAYEGITNTASGPVPNIGPLEAASLPPFLGVLAVAGGIAFLIASRESGTNR